MGHRLCTVLLIVPCLLLAGLASPDALAVSGVASAAPARSAIKVTVDWPHAPVRSRTVTVHVTRADDRPTIARLQMQIGQQWMTTKQKVVSARTFVFRPVAPLNRYRLRVVLPQRHVASHGFAAPQPAPLVRRVSYPDGVVWSRYRGQALTLVFDGRRGQDVQLSTSEDGDEGCRSARLRGPSGAVPLRRSGLWRLPRTGAYRVEVGPCWGHGPGRTSADLSRVRLVPLVVDARPVLLVRRPDVTEIGVVTLRSSGRVMVRGWQPQSPVWTGVTTPSGVRVTTGYDASPVYLEAGKPLTDGLHSAPMTSGQYLFQPGSPAMTASASTAIGTAVAPEGAAATLGDGGVPGRERTFTFTGTAGSFVYPEPALPSSGSGGSAGLEGPDGAPVPDWNFNQGWLVPSDGTYTLRVTPGLSYALHGSPVTVRVRQAVELPTMPHDTTTRFTVDQPDRWAFARVEVPYPPYAHLFTSSGSTMSGAWEAILGWSRTNYCGPGPGANGCGDNFYAPLNQDVTEARYQPWSGITPTLVVLRPGAGVTGGVDLALRPR